MKREDRVGALVNLIGLLDEPNLALAEFVIAQLPADALVSRLRAKTLEGVERMGEDRKVVEVTDEEMAAGELFSAFKLYARAKALPFPKPGLLPGVGPK